MKKLMYFLLFFTALLCNIDQNVDGINDPKAETMGFDIDLTVYTTYLDYDWQGVNFFENSTIIGYTELHSAVYSLINDSDVLQVTNYMKIQPKDGWVGFMKYRNVRTDYAEITSHVDGEFINWGYGAYHSSADYMFMSPTPVAQASMVQYEVGIQLTAPTPPVFGLQTSIEDNELDIYTPHDYQDRIFDVKYKYSCINFGFDCSYANTSTDQKASYKIDKSNEYTSVYRGEFIQAIHLEVRFRNSNGVVIFTGTATTDLLF